MSFPVRERVLTLQIDSTKFSIRFVQYFANIKTFPVRFCQGIHPIIPLIGAQWREATPIACGSVRSCRMVGTEGLTTRRKDIMNEQI